MIKFRPAGICLGLMILSGSYYVVSQHISGKASLSESIGTLDGWFFPYRIRISSQWGLEIYPGTMRKNKVKPIYRRVQWFWGLIIFWGERVDVFLGDMRVRTGRNPLADLEKSWAACFFVRRWSTFCGLQFAVCSKKKIAKGIKYIEPSLPTDEHYLCISATEHIAPHCTCWNLGVSVDQRSFFET